MRCLATVWEAATDEHKKDTSMKIKSRLGYLLPVILSMGLVACSKVEYDYKALGFSDKAEMEAKGST